MAKGKVTVKDLLSRLDNIGRKVDKFNETEEQKDEATKAEFAQIPLADGTIIEYDGDIATGTAVFVVGEDGEQMPAPEGTHELGGELAGTSIIVNSEGVIEEVVTEDAQSADENAEEQPKDEAMSAEDIEAIVEAKVSKLLEPMTELIENKFGDMEASQNELKDEFAKFKQAPSTEKKETKKFNRDEDMTPRQRIIMSRRNKK